MTELESIFTDIAGAIRSKASVSTAFKPSQMASAIMDIPSGGGGGSFVAPHAFYNDGTVTQYSGNEKLIGTSAFTRCSNLSEVLFPECKYIEAYAFTSCYSLTSVSFPECEYIEMYAFASCYSLTSVSFPNCSYIGNGAFSQCSLLEVSFPNCSYIGDYAFRSCSKLTTASFPECTSLQNGAFSSCTNLTTVTFSKLASFTNSYTTSPFRGCYKLSSLYLLSTAKTGLFSSTIFTDTMLSTTGTIYVPSSLYDTYKTAAGWIYFSSRFASI